MWNERLNERLNGRLNAGLNERLNAVWNERLNARFDGIEYNIVLELNENDTVNAVTRFIKNWYMTHVSACQ